MPRLLTKKEIKKVQSEKFTRVFSVKRDHIDVEKRTVEIAFSSEEPYQRWWGIEILDHDKKSVRLGRLENKAPFLNQHDSDDLLGVIEEVSLDSDRKGRAVVRFGKSARAEEYFQDVIDGIREKISVGYFIHKMVLEEETDDSAIYRVSDWEPFEISLVSIPADDSVGVGRSEDFETQPKNPEVKTMTPEEIAAEATKKAEAKSATIVLVNAAREDALKKERERISTIQSIAKEHKKYDLADKAAGAIETGMTVDDFQRTVLAVIAEKGVTVETPDIGMNEREVKRFSIMNVARALHSGDWADAGFERECSDAVAKKLGAKASGCYVPTDVQKRQIWTKDMTVGGSNVGEDLVGTDHLAASFIELLYNAMQVRALGATILSGLVGNVSIPKLATGSPGTWVAESGTPTERTPTTAAVTLAPKTVSTHVDISRQLLLQSAPSVEQMITRDMATQLALSVDLAALHGTGANNQPTGIALTSGIGSVAGGTDGLAPAWSHIVDLETEVAVDNALVGSVAYLTNAKVRGKLKQVEKASSTAQFVWDDDGLNGYRTEVSNQVRSDLVKGSSGSVASAIFFGNWADLLIGEWGTLDLIRDPFALSTAGGLRLVALMSIDIAVRHPQSFAAMLDALTV